MLARTPLVERDTTAQNDIDLVRTPLVVEADPYAQSTSAWLARGVKGKRAKPYPKTTLPKKEDLDAALAKFFESFGPVRIVSGGGRKPVGAKKPKPHYGIVGKVLGIGAKDAPRKRVNPNSPGGRALRRRGLVDDTGNVETETLYDKIHAESLQRTMSRAFDDPRLHRKDKPKKKPSFLSKVKKGAKRAWADFSKASKAGMI